MLLEGEAHVNRGCGVMGDATIILSWPVRAISSTAPVRGVTARDLSCLEVVHHLGAVYDGVIFSGRAGRD